MKTRPKSASTGQKRPKKATTTPKASKKKKQTNPAEVRNDIAKIVKSGAKKITKAVMDQAMTGQLAPAKYLFEVAGVYPPITDGSQATSEEECFAKTLLDRLDIPDEPVSHDDEDDAAAKTNGLKREVEGGTQAGRQAEEHDDSTGADEARVSRGSV